MRETKETKIVKEIKFMIKTIKNDSLRHSQNMEDKDKKFEEWFENITDPHELKVIQKISNKWE
ncbi:MAG: hypothetical protein ACRC4M_04645 [Mycoplasma sp.]